MGADARRGTGGLTIIAEIGCNHGGQIELAHRLIRSAKAAGADYAKFQAFQPDQHTGAYRELLEPLAFTGSQMRSLKAYCEQHEIGWLCTPFDLPSLDLVVDMQPDAMKVSSRHARDLAFLREIRKRWHGPIWQSFGAATLRDIQTAHDITRPDVAFHCVSAYPAPVEACDLRSIEFGFNGWSDHTGRADVAPLAVALGALVIEAHLTYDRGAPGPDHTASLEPHEFARLVQGCRMALLARGDWRQVPHPCELANRESFPVTA